MKKALALVMAIAMVASMAAVSFAAVNALTPVTPTTPAAAGAVANYDTNLYTYTASTDRMDIATAPIKFGSTVYVMLLDDVNAGITASKSVDNLKISATWTEGSEFVTGVEIVKLKTAYVDGVVDPAKYFYYVAISTTGDQLEQEEVEGTIYLKGKSGSDKTDANYKVDHKFAVNFTLGYPDAGAVGASLAVNSKNKTVYDFTASTDTEYEVTFGGKFVVTANVKSEKDVLLACNEDVIEEVDEAYPDANIDYYALTGAFKKTATVVVELEEGEEFLYAVVDGQVVEVNGEYDDWEEAFVFKARKLGTYIISDVELELAEEVVVANPSTGAVA